MIKYAIMESSTPNTLEREVEEMSTDGWELYGHPIIVHVDGTWFYHQIMTKEIQ